MKAWIIVVGILVILAVVIMIRVRYELVTLQRSDYEIHTDKIEQGRKLRLVVISDLHNRTYGEENSQLFQMIQEAEPDYILAAGDLITASSRKDMKPVFHLLSKLTSVAPVFYSPGNHEKRIAEERNDFPELEENFRTGLKETGVTYLENEQRILDKNVCLSGLDMDFRFYKKLKAPKYELTDLKKDLPETDLESFHILLAHSPKYFETYAEAGYDLVLSGHYHGGAVRLPGIGGVISPQFVPFPKYSKGKYVLGKTTMIVSSGCGSHKVNLRLFNKPEVMVVEINGNSI